ncbi:hypothetical protein ES705_20319 [subsurface metagenome]
MDAPSEFFSPILREIIAVVPTLNPNPRAYIMVNNDSVIPTVATASEPSFDTKKMSTRAKIDSITISRTMGMESNKIARPSLPSVKSISVPRMDSTISFRIFLNLETSAWCTEVIFPLLLAIFFTSIKRIEFSKMVTFIQITIIWLLNMQVVFTEI